ncbi:DEAD/DEAH box helicase [Achromobacter aloeverae]|uniref:DEAD-box ATP-dependent RNA helicase RhpA n=1 Tax=Achromobacter aloeverae TaxID=1750518 RepID=A0A4Q1HHE3_9BURK|nr:DEAD/DEAH box helicase [Achromobacter aloeverae]RXN86837.1 RNA helicase [Achromobacter aloeverae]
MSFESLGLAPTLLSALEAAGFSAPTPVQAAAIPQALAGHDLMVSSQTGSGKTAAFMLPALNRVAKQPANKGSGVQVLVLTPTRELAMQVNDATRIYGRNIADLRTTIVVGGMPYGAQLKALSRRVDVLVATPGRLLDHLQAGRVKLNTVHTLVLDEADRMLDMGFIEDIETILARLPAERQTLLFSATLDGSVARLAAKMMREPQRIEIAGAKEKHGNITQSLLYADDLQHKMQLLDHVLRDATLDQAIVFTATKRGADDLAGHLSDQGFAAAALHGDMNQRQRTRTLGLLQRGQLRVLVATDVAARGIDVQGISHAVNYDLPMQAEDYVHRIGRTGRAGRDGLAFTLATHAERHKVRRIEHFIGQTIAPQIIAGLEPKRAPRPHEGDRGGKRGFAGKRPQGRGRPFEGGDRPRSFGGGDRPQGGWRGGDRPGYEQRSPRPDADGRTGGFRAERAERGGFRTDDAFRSEGFRREGGARPEGGFRREGGARPEGGFRREGGARPEGGFRREGGARPEGGFRREGGARPEGGFRREGGARPEGGFRREGGARPEADGRPGGFRSEGGFRREGGPRHEGGPRSEGSFRAERREGAGGHGSGDGYARPARPAFEKRAGGPAKRFDKPGYAGRRD